MPLNILKPNNYRMLPNLNQVIYISDTIGKSNIMILAQAVLQILCSHCPLRVKCLKLKTGIIQSTIDKIL